MDGLSAPVLASNFPMCSTINNTCCKEEDQLKMYQQFISSGELDKIQKRFEQNLKIYDELIEQLKEVSEFSKIMKKNIQKKVSNCKFLADRILNFSVESVQENIHKTLEKMKNYFTQAYQGFYCTICDADKAQFISKEKKKVIFSQQFCRKTVENVLPTLLIFHIDVAKLIGLASRLVSSCDFQGEYNMEGTYPKQYEFLVDQKLAQDLKDCRDNRNKNQWFSYCKSLCNNLSMTKVNEYFEPHLKQIEGYNAYLKEMLI